MYNWPIREPSREVGEEQKWETAETIPEVSEEQKWKTVEQLRHMSDQEIFSLLNDLALQGWDAILPSFYKRQFDCKLPNNEHSETAMYKLECQKDPKHTFCLHHHFYNNLCPLCPSKNASPVNKVKL